MLTVAILQGCSSPGQSVSSARASASVGLGASPTYPAATELAWDQVEALVRGGEVIVALPVADGRVHLDTKRGPRMTTAPSPSALSASLDTAPPSFERPGTTRFYADCAEVSWPAAEKLLRGGQVDTVEESAVGRVFIRLADREHSCAVSYPARSDAVATILAEVRQRPLFPRHFRYRDVPWSEIERTIHERRARLSVLHGSRVTHTVPDGEVWLACEPALNETLRILDQVDPQRSMLTAIE